MKLAITAAAYVDADGTCFPAHDEEADRKILIVVSTAAMLSMIVCQIDSETQLQKVVAVGNGKTADETGRIFVELDDVRN